MLSEERLQEILHSHYRDDATDRPDALWADSDVTAAAREIAAESTAVECERLMEEVCGGCGNPLKNRFRAAEKNWCQSCGAHWGLRSTRAEYERRRA